MMSKTIAGWGLKSASVADRMAVARDYVRQHAPYFGKILYGLRFVPVPGLGTLSTTRNLVCGYDPEYVARISTDAVAAIIAHEILHVLHNHFDRLIACKDRDLANIAADLPINVDLRNAQHKGKPVWALPTNGAFPENYNLPPGKTAEQYYDLLLKEKAATAQRKSGSDQCKNKAADGPNPGQGQGSAPSQSTGKADDPSDPKGTCKGAGVACGSCGGVAGNTDHPALAEVEGRTEVERAAMVMQVGQAIREHLSQHGRGSVPASLIDWLDAASRPSRKDWRGHLGTLLRNCSGRIQSGGDDYSMSRPSKRSFLRGMIRPGLIENMPVIAFVLDTSGSMGQEQLVASVVEAISILEALGIDEVWFAEADAAVALNFRLVGGGHFRKLKIAGRGGTDFRPAFAAAEKLNPPPDMIVYFTDGDGRAPRAPPRGMETVWCIVPSYYNRRPAPWGHAVLITDDPTVQLREPIVVQDDGVA